MSFDLHARERENGAFYGMFHGTFQWNRTHVRENGTYYGIFHGTHVREALHCHKEIYFEMFIKNVALTDVILREN